MSNETLLRVLDVELTFNYCLLDSAPEFKKFEIRKTIKELERVMKKLG
jgi:hypothetical protein